MKIVKTLVLASLLSTLAGCGSDAIEGKFNVQASVMGFKSNVGTAELDEDYITLLGMRCPDDDLIYTGYIDGADIVNNLEPKHIAYLREPHFYTVFDVFSRDMNKQLSTSEKHPILSNLHSIRFLDTMTCVAEEAFFRGLLQRPLGQLLRQRGVATHSARTQAIIGKIRRPFIYKNSLLITIA